MEMETFDLIVAGSALAGIQTALEIRKQGGSVLLFTHRTYLGEDICDPMRLALPEEVDLSDPLAERLFGEAVRGGQCIRPMHLKHQLDLILEEADIPVLLCATPLGLLQNGDGLELEVHTRSGNRTFMANRILDNTPRGEIGRMAGVPMSAPVHPVKVLRRVLAETPEAGWKEEGIVELPQDGGGQRLHLCSREEECVLEDGSWEAWMALEQGMRARSYLPGQLYSADGVEVWTGEHVHPDIPLQECGGEVTHISREACSDGSGRIFFSGSVLGIDEATAKDLRRYDRALAWGKHLATVISSASAPGTLPASPDVPELTKDVLVVGGGTGGAPAGVAVAREGVDTLLVEALSGLGGVGTLGMIGRYWFGNQVGFTAEMDAAVEEKSPREVEGGGFGGWDVEAKMQWYHEQIHEAGGRIWYKCTPAGADSEHGRITRVRIATPQGPVWVKVGAVVDATGCGEVAAQAGAETVAAGGSRLAIQGTGLPNRQPGQDYNNTDYEFIDEHQAEDLASAHVSARQKFQDSFDAGQLVDSRERRRIRGEIEVSPIDIRLGRIFPDSVVKARSNFDTHGYTIHPLFMIVPPGHDPIEAYIPLRALLPRGLEGILVTGLGISAHRDAMPVIRMQADVQNQGYAAGMIAAMSQGRAIRSLELDAIQARLVEKGILAPEIRGAADSFPLSADIIQEAIRRAPEDANWIDRVFSLPEAERNEVLREAYHQAAEESDRRFFAFVLGVLGEDAGVDTLLEEVAEREWDEGWDYTGMGQFGASMSELDARIIALGRCGDARAVEVLRDKVKGLPAETSFSHLRALAEALETLEEGADLLEELLQRPGIRGHAVRNQAERNAVGEGSGVETHHRNVALIELHLATSLFRISSHSALARETLSEYASDLRGLFSRHARNELAHA